MCQTVLRTGQGSWSITETIYVVEQNRDAQVAAILKEHYPEYATHIQSILHYNGMPIDAETIVSKLLALLS